MPGVLQDSGLSYVSSHSADVILSDVRPIRLKIEALKSINVLLDEFLYNILKSACSLSTDKLRGSLLRLLPTYLGKEALLEAEVELRAYYERMGAAAVSPLGDDSKTFNLQYAFELLRLKCAAYSTLNDTDEDPNAEAHVMERMKEAGVVPFMPTRIAPAALYLTAIVEAMCEHILTNVARVAARDSSRTDATVQDVFIALCEDEAIYSLFRSMKVYEQIEQLSNSSGLHRSKSFTRKEQQSSLLPRTASPFYESTTTTMTASVISQRSRLSEGSATVHPGTAAPSSGSGSRSSIEKSRAVKKLISNRSSHDGDAPSAHTRMISASQSGSPRRSGSVHDDISYEGAAALQEFDDLMRSSSTMKVSLTPDRLKTMEAYKQEKDHLRTERHPPEQDRSPSSSSLRLNGRIPSARKVESIVEDEEENIPSKPSMAARSRQGSVTSSPSPSLASLKANRTRSLSTSTPGSRQIGKKLLRNAAPPVSSSTLFQASFPAMQPSQNPRPVDVGTFPSRTRRAQRNRDSLDMDEVMNGSEEEDIVIISKHVKHPTASGCIPREALSSSTRELVDFLSQGPPEFPRARTFDVSDVSNHSSSTVATESGKKGPGRLQRMISKLSLGGSDKSRTGEDATRTPPRQLPATQPSLLEKRSYGTLSPLANRPIPPRYPRPPSPPPSPPSQSSLEEPVTGRPRTSSISQKPSEYRSAGAAAISTPLTSYSQHSSSVVVQKRDERENVSTRQTEHGVNGISRKKGTSEARVNDINSRSHRSPPSINKPYPTTPAPSSGATPAQTPLPSPPQTLARSSSLRKPVPPLIPPIQPPVTTAASPPHATASVQAATSSILAENDVRDMHRLMSNARSAEECRLILDMFLSRAGIRFDGKPDAQVSTPPPPPTSISSPIQNDSPLENSLVEFLLGGEVPQEHGVRKLRSKRHKKDLVRRPHTADGSQRSPSTFHISTGLSNPPKTPVTFTSQVASHA
ncbi:hypothetical protein AX17_002130 [Amanita inopinata Kibby_2008]|nr:hypothetical protein AX17_002130 [Amanita inopinata Kibby_2008]